MATVKIEVNCYEVKEIKECFSCKGHVEVDEAGVDIVLGDNTTFMCDDCGDVFLKKMLTEFTGVDHN
ncbi:hypothetical protein [uncultured Clostridium sp.]|jgi:predicted RNA-binding Zn-ribbon protein involved in translation (DUF1610 family)|uniref:hypothetical protein n=1 Tax=uncultured Clostridium sp. TaxID=59620 RepID=UPI00263006DD|nr:hypothetical protein [uncultured Clostridium sp.]